MEFKSIKDLEKWFYKSKGDIVKFHFNLSNHLHLIIVGYQQGSIYCFCDKIKKKSLLWKMQSAFEKEKKNGLERLVVYQYNMKMLTKIANEIFPFLKECFELSNQSLDFCNKEYLWPFHCCDGSYYYLNLQDIIDYDDYMYKLEINNTI